MASKSANVVVARNGSASIRVTIVIHYAKNCVAGSCQLPHIEVTARLTRRLCQLKNGRGNVTAANAGKLNVPSPGSIAIAVWIAFSKTVKDHIVHSSETFLSNTTWT